MRRTRLKIIALLLAAACLLTGCGGAAAGDGEEEPLPEARSAGGAEPLTRQAADNVFSVNYDPEAPMNPIRAESAANMQFWSLLYDSVFIVDENFQASSEVVTEYTTEDNSWWVFHIDTSITFSDGEPLMGRDVAYSIQLARQTDYYGARLSCVYGVSAVDVDAFAISTTQPNSMLPSLLNIPIIKMGDYFEDFPLGTGPYVLSEDHKSLVLNPGNRHAGEMPLDTVYLADYMDASARITAFEDARLDIVTNDPTGMYNLGYGSSNETRYFDTANMHYIGFNTRSNYFQFFRTRCAVSYVIDRDNVVDNLMNGCGVAAALPVHPNSGLYDAEYAATLAYDPETSRALFEAAGVGDLDNDGALEIMVTGIVVELRIRFIVNNDSSVKVAAARKITEELNAMGITTTLYELSWDDFIDALEEGDYDMYYGEVRLGMDWDLSCLFRVPDAGDTGPDRWGVNYAKNTDESYGRLYASYLAASEVGRYDAYQEAAHYICDTGIIIPICFERRQVLTHRGAVSGIRATQFDLFHRFQDWTVTLE